MSTYLKITLVLSFFLQFTFCQNDSIQQFIKKDGYTYYLVSKGETKYGISKSLGITIAELESINPFIRKGLESGHNLVVPITGRLKKTINFKHLVLSGETLLSIANKYNLTINEIKNLNNGLNDEPIVVGQELWIYKKVNYEDRLNIYTVKKGDTKYSLAKRFGMSIAKLEALNPQIVDMLFAGAVLQLGNTKIKQENNRDKPYVKKEIAEKTSKPKEGNKIITKKPKTSLNKKNKAKFEVLWTEQKDYTSSKIKSQKTTDYLKGLNDAIQDVNLKNTQQSVKLKKLKPDNNYIDPTKPSETTSYFIKPKFTFYGDKTNNLGTFEIHKINGDEKTNITIKALPSSDDMHKHMLKFLAQKKGIIVCVYDGSSNENIDLIKNQIPDIKLIELNRSNNYKANELKNILDKNSKNYIIVKSAQVSTYLNVTNILLKKSSQYIIQLVALNPNNIPPKTKISHNRFKILNLMFPMPYNPNTIKKDVSNEYWSSFIVTSDILNRLKTNGTNAFKNKNITKTHGTKFSYDYSNNIAKNSIISIYAFGEKAEYLLIDEN